MTPQQIFDTVATHLFTQGHRAMSEDGTTCLYRAPNGDTCAVGCLIQDYYIPEMDKGDFLLSSGITEIVMRFYDILPEWIVRNVKLLGALQDVHDRTSPWRSVDAMKASLEFVAIESDLDSSVLNKFDKFGE